MADSVFGPGLGQAHEVGQALRRAGSTAGGMQRIIEDPLHAVSVAAAIEGDLALSSIPLEQQVERETGFLETICGWAGIASPDENEVATLLEKVQETRKGILLPHDRIVPAGLDLPLVYEGLYGFNRDRGERGGKIKLFEESKEWFRRENVRGETTQFAVHHLDFNNPFSLGMNHEPFGLTYDLQIEWAGRPQQGGDGLTSVAETIYLYLRCALECHQLLWSGSSRRCRDEYDSEFSLCVDSSSDGGLRVGYYRRGNTHWYLGAFPRKCTKST